jgi:hypothetical protein
MNENKTIDSRQKAMSSEEYIKERLDSQIGWYDRKSAINKKYFIIFQIITLVASASIPVFSIFSEGNSWARILIAILGSATAITTGIVSLYQFREHWIEYRTTAESLKHEKYMFLTGTGPYAGEDAFSLMVERVETLLSQENTGWQQRLKTQKSEDKKSS